MTTELETAVQAERDELREIRNRQYAENRDLEAERDRLREALVLIATAEPNAKRFRQLARAALHDKGER